MNPMSKLLNKRQSKKSSNLNIKTLNCSPELRHIKPRWPPPIIIHFIRRVFKQSNWIKQWMAEPRLVRTFFEGDWNSVQPNMLGNLLKYMRVLVAIFNWSIRALWRWMWVRGWGSCGGCRIILNYTASHIMPGNVHLKYKVGERSAQPGWIVQPRFIHGCGRPEIASVSRSKIYTSKGIVDVSLQKKKSRINSE